MIDVLITTYNRVDFLKRTVESLMEKNWMIPLRLFICDDCSSDETPNYLKSTNSTHVFIGLKKKRTGVVDSFNLLWEAMEKVNQMDGEFPYLCYLQDDVLSIVEGWLPILLDYHERLKDQYPIGFLSGWDAPEHPIAEIIQSNGRRVILKRSQPGQNLLGEKSFWRSIGLPIPIQNPNGSERGFPGEGKGSNIDVYLTGCSSSSRFNPGCSSPHSLYRQKKYVMIIPGLLDHLGKSTEHSTWRA